VSQIPADLLDAALKLPEEARAELAQRLLDSLGSFFADPETEAAWADEIKRRIEDVKSGREKAIPLEEAWKIILDDSDADRRRLP
jgi:putative addiction module component (TIGR02574 family)